MTSNRTRHVCTRAVPVCSCYSLAMEPNDKCPVHGTEYYRPYCGKCGRYMKVKRSRTFKDVLDAKVLNKETICESI